MKSLFCLIVLLALASLPMQAEDDGMIGPFHGPSVPQQKAPLDALGKYKQFVYEVVGSYWYPAIEPYMLSVPPKIPKGKVRIRFTIHADGSLDNISVIEGAKFTKLASISLDALKAPIPFKPFSPELLKQVGDKYTDDFSFSTGDDAKKSRSDFNPSANSKP